MLTKFKVKPRGATNLGKDVKGIEGTVEIDFSLINPENVEIPEAIMNYALRSIIIDYQALLRRQCDVGENGLKEIQAMITAGDLKYTPGQKGTRTPRKSVADTLVETFKDLQSATNNKATKEDAFEVLAGNISRGQIIHKYSKK